MFGFQKIVEQRINEAMKRGDFEDLPGSGKPLEFKDANIPEDLRLAYKILKNAGFVPPEIEVKKQIQQTEELLAGMEDTEEKYRTMKKLNYLILKLNTLRQSPAHMEMPEMYEHKLMERFGKKQACQEKQNQGSRKAF